MLSSSKDDCFSGSQAPAANLAAGLHSDALTMFHTTVHELYEETRHRSEQWQQPVRGRGTPPPPWLSAPFLLSAAATTFSNAQAASNTIQQDWSEYAPCGKCTPMENATDAWWGTLMTATAGKLASDALAGVQTSAQRLASFLTGMSCAPPAGRSTSTSTVQSAHLLLQQWWMDQKLDHTSREDLASGVPDTEQVRFLSTCGIRIADLMKALKCLQWRMGDKGGGAPEQGVFFRRTHTGRMHPTTSTMHPPPQHVVGPWYLQPSLTFGRKEAVVIMQAAALSNDPALHLKALASAVHLRMQALQNPVVLRASLFRCRHLLATGCLMSEAVQGPGNTELEHGQDQEQAREVHKDLTPKQAHQMLSASITSLQAAVNSSEQYISSSTEILSGLVQEAQRAVAKVAAYSGVAGSAPGGRQHEVAACSYDRTLPGRQPADANQAGLLDTNDPSEDSDGVTYSKINLEGYPAESGNSPFECHDSSCSSSGILEPTPTQILPQHTSHAVLHSDGRARIVHSSLNAPPPAGPAASGAVWGARSAIARPTLTPDSSMVAHLLLKEHMASTGDKWQYAGAVSDDDST